MFEKLNHSICVTRDRCSLKKSCRAKTVSWVFLSKTPIVNVTLMGEVLQNRFSLFMQKNVCTGDIVCQKCKKTVYRLEENGVGQLESSVPLTSRYQVHLHIQRIQPLVRNSFQLNVRWMIIGFRRLVKILLHIQTSRFLFFFLLENLRRSIFFVANSQMFCDLWNRFTRYFW